MEIESKNKLGQWWAQLVWESEREFVSPYSVDECVSRLKVLDEKFHKERSSFLSIFRIYIRNIEDKGDYFSFKMDIHASKVILSAELFGQLIRQDAKATQVKSRYGYTLGSIITLILLLPTVYIFSVITIGASPSNDLIFLGICIFALFMQISFSYGMKNQLHREIHKELAGDTQVAKVH